MLGKKAVFCPWKQPPTWPKEFKTEVLLHFLFKSHNINSESEFFKQVIEPWLNEAKLREKYYIEKVRDQYQAKDAIRNFPTYVPPVLKDEPWYKFGKSRKWLTIDEEEAARKITEEKARKVAEEKARKVAEEKAKKEAEEKARKVAEEKARKEKKITEQALIEENSILEPGELSNEECTQNDIVTATLESGEEKDMISTQEGQDRSKFIEENSQVAKFSAI
jgi:hypothetical protein